MTDTTDALSARFTLRESGCPMFQDPERLFDDLAATRAQPGLPPVHAFGGARLVTRYADVVQALHDPDTFSSEPTVGQVPSPWRERFAGRVPDRGTLLGLDDPDHRRLRASVNTFFQPRRLRRFEPFIREQAHRLIDGFAASGRVELKTAFALPLPLTVIARIVGLDPERAEEYGAALGFFLGPRDIHHTGTPDEKADRLLGLHDELLELMAARRTDRRDDLISHIWEQRDSGAAPMTDFEMLSMFPGLMLAGHETSSNVICMTLGHLLEDPERWEHAQRSDATRAAALEEMVRIESAITGMRRRVTADTSLGGVELHAGEEVLLAYAAASRDPEAFDRPDEIDLDRTWETPRLGFGRGVHACLGAPLARLLLRIELEVLHDRLPGLRLDAPAGIEHSVVAETRGVVALPIVWDADAAVRMMTARASSAGSGAEAVAAEADGAAEARTDARWRSAEVVSKRTVADGVIELVLAPAEGPVDWSPGAHIDLELADGLVRQYSLSGVPARAELRIGVRIEDAGRGGSVAVRDRLEVGARIRFRGPRSHFRLRADDGFACFVAGGIGITPLLPMISEAVERGLGWRLLYLGRARSGMAYLDDLLAAHPGLVYAWPSDERGRYPLDDLWQRLPEPDARVYACGPDALLAELEATARSRGVEDRLVVERFAPRDVAHDPDRSFEAELARSGRVVQVPIGVSLLDAVNGAGAGVLSTCREGTCGTCEVRVLGGVPEHRDSVLDLEDRLRGDTVITCVSRCRGSRLVLDL